MGNIADQILAEQAQEADEGKPVDTLELMIERKINEVAAKLHYANMQAQPGLIGRSGEVACDSPYAGDPEEQRRSERNTLFYLTHEIESLRQNCKRQGQIDIADILEEAITTIMRKWFDMLADED